MTNFRLATDTQQKACNAVVDDIDFGTGAGTIQIRSGIQPANANAVASGTLLGTLTFSDPAFGSANTSGVATASAITGDTSADATGTATWARVLDSSANVVFDCDVGTTATTIILDSVSIVAGGTIDLTSFTVTMPSGV